MEVSWKVKNTLDLLNSCCVVSAVPGISCRARDRAHGADGNPAAQRAHAPRPDSHSECGAPGGFQAQAWPMLHEGREAANASRSCSHFGFTDLLLHCFGRY